MKITMMVETKRTDRGEIRNFNSTVDALNYMKRKGYKDKFVVIWETKNGKSIVQRKHLSTRTMGYVE